MSLCFNHVKSESFLDLYDNQGCQIFLAKHTKTGKLYQRTTNYTIRPYIIPNIRNLYQMAVKFTNIIHSKALQNIPKLGCLVLK
jgi:hypothetical protein